VSKSTGDGATIDAMADMLLRDDAVREVKQLRKGVINDLDNVVRRPQQHYEGRRGGGAYRCTHGRSERPGVCGARFRRHAECAGCAPGAAASGSTHRCTTAAIASTTAGW
jgi:hypothetical protein